jgi:hypothetical protein
MTTAFPRRSASLGAGARVGEAQAVARQERTRQDRKKIRKQDVLELTGIPSGGVVSFFREKASRKTGFSHACAASVSK